MTEGRFRRIGRWMATACLLGALLPGHASPPQDRADRHEDPDFAGLERLIVREMESAGVPGLSMAVIRDGAIVYRGAFGVTNLETGEPITERTLFEAASLSKPVFAYFTMLQVDKGLLDLDRPLHEYLPHESLVPDPRHELLTARMVLAHASGLPNWRSETGGELKLLFEPGTRFGYSGEAYEYLKSVLGHILRTDDEGLQAHLKREVADPAGARYMQYTWDDAIPSLKAFGHRNGAVTDNDRHDRNFGAAYSLITTPSDYARFLIALMRPVGSNAAVVEDLLSLQTALPPERGEMHRSLGFPVKKTGKGFRYYHSGNNGDFRAYCHFYRDTGDGVVIFGNSDNLFTSDLAGHVVEYLGDRWFYM
ncbi:serine hydrolase domain-containing protein [Marilutibacter chinensis]|uniref:Beta-lactamase family protein n=1 Tax=Marilutibacter chinensis TaxID=2912247 RepID=A0ABS9HQR6_9GAMM|nr:serine hydrolase domain-containing protein [Lysobacter chinensis]MCF7220725.1 beta-lactamase family protein [Lysobacter chinensis]